MNDETKTEPLAQDSETAKANGALPQAIRLAATDPGSLRYILDQTFRAKLTRLIGRPTNRDAQPQSIS